MTATGNICGRTLEANGGGAVSSTAGFGDSLQMKTKTKEERFVEKALKKMFEVVGERFSWEFCLRDEWYLTCEWTKNKEEQFRKWFMAEIKKDLDVSKRKAENEYAYFNLTWGWKNKSSLNSQKK